MTSRILKRYLFLLNGVMLPVVSITAAPMISVDSAEFNMGVVMEGKLKSMKHSFIVKNTGDDTLKIQKVKPG